MKALIIYDDFATVVRANVALQYSGRNADFPVQWNVNLWQIDMLKFSPTAEEALTDALAAHLIVIANSCAKSSTIWFQSWVEHWAKCRYINGAGLALAGHKNLYDCIKAFSQTDFTEDLKRIDIPALVIHGDDDQVVPFDITGRVSVKLLKQGKLIVYPGAPHAIPDTHKEKLNADLLSFIKS